MIAGDMSAVNANRVIVLFSGGVESSCLLYHHLINGQIVYPLYIRAGHPWERLELINAKRLWRFARLRHKNLMPMRVVSFPVKSIRAQEVFIPLRNLSLVAIASALAYCLKANSVSIGSLGHYPFQDNSKQYMQELESLIFKGAHRHIKVEAPFMEMHKAEVLRSFENIVPFNMTLSCMRPYIHSSRIFHCGSCQKCQERYEAMSEAFGYVSNKPAKLIK